MILNDLNSIKSIIGDTNQAMVYGFEHCYYDEIGVLLKTDPFNFRVFNACVGLKNEPVSTRTTLENSIIHQLPLRLPISINAMCKCALTNIVFENFKRIINCLPIIPILFCIDTNSNEYPISAKNILIKNSYLNILTTHSELRRAYKLCFDTDIDPRLNIVAQNTFKFAKVEQSQNSEDQNEDNEVAIVYRLIKAEAPWTDKLWNAEWTKRKSASKERKKEDWRTDLAELIAKEEGIKTEVEKKESRSTPKSPQKTYCKEKRCVDYSILEQETQDDPKKIKPPVQTERV